MLALAAAGILGMGLSYAQLAGGNYTINSGNPTSGSNFNSFNDFITALSNASNSIAGAITVEVVQGSGPYNETITIPALQGTGPGPGGTRIGITFKGNGEKISYNGGSTSNATIELDGADYITFQNLEIERRSSGSYKWGVRLWNQADHIRFDSCTINMGTSYSTSYWVGIMLSSSNTSYSSYADHANFLEVWNTNFIGGYYGITCYGTSSSTGGWSQGRDIKGCTFDTYYAGVYMYYGNYDINISDNVFLKNQLLSAYQYGYAVYAYQGNNYTVSRNIIGTGYAYGLYGYYWNYYNTSTVSGRIKVTNNQVFWGNASGSNTYMYGMRIGYAQDMDFVYNSINLNKPGMTSTNYGAYVYYLTNGNVVNNVFKTESSSTSNYLIYGYNNTNTTFDYNTFYSESSTSWRIYWNGTYYYDLSSFVSASGTNSNSQWADPAFVSPTDCHINGANLYQKGTPYTGVTVDWDGTTRSATAPSPGIHEFTPPQNDAGVTIFTQPVAVCPDTNDIIVTVKNYGALPLGSFKVHWTVDRGASSIAADSMQVTASVALAPGADTSITLSTVVMAGGAPDYDFVAWTTHPNGVTDEQFENDTAKWSTQTAMFGTYTIGGTTPDFATFTAAANALNTYDVCGAVVFNVRSGTYNEYVHFGVLAGASSTNTVTFQADPGNTAPVQLQNNAGASNEDGVILLDQTMYMTFDGIDIEALNSGGLSTVVWLKNTAYVNFLNCSMHTGSTSDINLYIQETNYSTFQNNVITGGSYGIYLYGNSSIQNVENTLTDNHVEDVYSYALYLYYQDKIHLEGNWFDARKSTASITSYGAYMYMYYSNYATIKKNYFGGHYYGAYIYMQGTSGSKPEITNNKFQAGDLNLSSSYGYYGCYMYAGFATFAHNLVVSEGNVGTYYNCYINGGLNNVYNNVFVRDGIGYCYYNGGGFTVADQDYNAYGTYHGSQQGLAYAQSLGFDPHGVEIDTSVAIFDSYDSLYTCNDSLVGRGIPLPLVPDDINGYTRNTQAPTIGPEEYVSPGAFTLGEDFDICDGDTAFIGQEIFGATYLWTPGGDITGIKMVTSPGTYGVAISTGCGNASDNISVGNGEAVANFAATNSWLTAIFSNLSQKAYSYNWDFGDGGTSTDMNPNHIYPAEGKYFVCLTVEGDCGTNMYCDSVYVTEYIGIPTVGTENVVNIYPNPVKDVVYINVSGVKGNTLYIEISNISGQVVMRHQLNDFNGGAQEQLDISSLTKGVFLVKIFTEEMTTTKRLVVQE